MSNHHSSCSSRTGGAMRRCDCGEDLSDNDKLWADFEGCAQSVARLYSDSSWRNFRGAAEGTTQLYKTSTDSYRRGFEKGFSSGSTSVAKEIFQAFRDPSKIDMNIVLEVLYRNMAIPKEERITVCPQSSLQGDTLAAVELFQQALNQPSASLSAQNANPLNEFLVTQVQRHRKRQRSPNSSQTSPTSQFKRQKRL